MVRNKKPGEKCVGNHQWISTDIFVSAQEDHHIHEWLGTEAW